jgi:diguanylate cyclase (GGDEF)-like protein
MTNKVNSAAWRKLGKVKQRNVVASGMPEVLHIASLKSPNCDARRDQRISSHPKRDVRCDLHRRYWLRSEIRTSAPTFPGSRVTSSPDQYFALIVPATCLLLGSVLIACWRMVGNQKYMLWLGTGYVLVALPLAAQCLMDNQQLANWSVACGVFYLSGSWATAQGMALRYNGTTKRWAMLLIISVTLAALAYYSYSYEALWLRMLSLNSGMALMLALAVPAVMKGGRSTSKTERLLRASYLLLVLYSLLRQAGWFWIDPAELGQQLSQSRFWLVMLAVNLLLNLLFLILLLASVLRELLTTLRYERNHDPLTKLLNRRAFFELAQERMRAEPHQRWALIACDLDHFKQLNDAYGHAAGDEALETAARIFLAQVRQDDLVTRFGGEEFLVLLRFDDLKLANQIAERMRCHLARALFKRSDERLTASFGVYLVLPGELLTDAIEHADTLLYKAKRGGRNRIVASEPLPYFA